MSGALHRLACAFRLWRLIGYDGKPMSWRQAREIALALHPEEP